MSCITNKIRALYIFVVGRDHQQGTQVSGSRTKASRSLLLGFAAVALEQCLPTALHALEGDQGRSDLMAQDRAIGVSAPGGADLRNNLRRDYPGLFSQ